MSYSIIIIVIKLKSCLKFIMNNDKSSLESPNILIFHYSNQIHYRLEINKIKSKWTWPIESWLYPLFWYSNSIEMKLEQLIFFFFISLNSARICRYFQLNLLVPRCSIGINCYSFLHRERGIPSHSIRAIFNIFLWFPNKINLYLYRCKIYIYIYEIVISCIKYFPIYRYIRYFCSDKSK